MLRRKRGNPVDAATPIRSPTAASFMPWPTASLNRSRRPISTDKCALANRSLSLKILPSQCLVDDCHSWSLIRVQFCKSSAVHNGNAHRGESNEVKQIEFALPAYPRARLGARLSRKEDQDQAQVADQGMHAEHLEEVFRRSRR